MFAEVEHLARHFFDDVNLIQFFDLRFPPNFRVSSRRDGIGGGLVEVLADEVLGQREGKRPLVTTFVNVEARLTPMLRALRLGWLSLGNIGSCFGAFIQA